MMLIIVIATFLSGYAIGTYNMLTDCREELRKTEQACYQMPDYSEGVCLVRD